jgi:CobQ-like glutamine amidotransferase family enzyme
VPGLRVLSLYPELMNIYADRGNIAVLRARCEWRGLGFEHSPTSLGERFDPDAHDLFYMGGGQDRDQVAVAHDMAETSTPFASPARG